MVTPVDTTAKWSTEDISCSTARSCINRRREPEGISNFAKTGEREAFRSNVDLKGKIAKNNTPCSLLAGDQGGRVFQRK